MKQVVEHKKIGAMQGVLLVAGLVAAVVLLDFLCARVLPALIGYRPASLAFWIVGGVIALAVLRIFVVKYIYELSADLLRLNRSYGKRPRHIEDIYLRQIIFVGEVEEAKRRYPGARRVHAKRGRELPVTAVVYKTSDGERMALIQPNEALMGKLKACARENRKK